MLWLTWRQFRTQAAVVFGLLAAVAVVLAVTGPHLLHLYDTTVKPCASHGDCNVVTTAFTRNDRLLQELSQVVLVAPLLIGMFWGAPLVARELENHTFRLVWTQSVSRTRWLAYKLGLIGAASVAAAGLLSLMVTWWSSPFDTFARMNASPFSPSYFDHRDLVPIGYAAFAFALGVTFGALMRRTLPAMAATFVAFIGVRLADWEWLRPHLNSPLTTTTAFQVPTGNGPLPFALNPSYWVITNQTINATGKVIGENGGLGTTNGDFSMNVSPSGTVILSNGATCANKVHLPNLGAAGLHRVGPPSQRVTDAVQECINRLGIREVLTYQPTSRYWPFQWYETAIYIGLALALAAFCVWWVRRRLS
jgi:hypothetical protein